MLGAALISGKNDMTLTTLHAITRRELSEGSVVGRTVAAAVHENSRHHLRIHVGLREGVKVQQSSSEEIHPIPASRHRVTDSMQSGTQYV